MPELTSYAEDRAAEATTLPSLPINLIEVKRAVREILSQFGKGLMFHEYTTHDISHVNDMLRMIDWLVPKQTKDALSKAEWLMVVLSIYFHDMGLIVTEEEFQQRSLSGFQEFCDKMLFSSTAGEEYKHKIDSLLPDIRDRFLYQEFVRANHARRVRCWIDGKPSVELGYATAQISEIGRLLNGLDLDFRRDLGMVCESHNLDDIENVTKYRVSYPYGNSEDETVNLQYCAVLLRTIDLLQITRHRTPSVLYRLINPTDPISQQEWAKQAAVKSVRARVAMDREGNANANLQSDTVEVFATFTDDNAFFGLTSYLRYAGEQLANSFEVLQKSRRLSARPYAFPWRYVDDTNVEVEGFLKRTFGFEIDQDRILDLLTGHTLYNDSNVVIRELAQNAIDAVRLQCTIQSIDPTTMGKVAITWDSMNSELTVADNGTGMTQEIIERHLLKVGSSRYQDPKFREQYPHFSPISRFGIGILSSFMVADSVEIVTVSPDEEQARQISLRSVHGKYLIRLLDKSENPALLLQPHGTCIKIRFRSTARKLDILRAVRNWVLFPRCNVTVKIDDGEPEKIGYDAPKDALQSYLDRSPLFEGAGRANLKVEEKTVNGLTLSYALQFSSHFRDWGLVNIARSRRPDPDKESSPSVTCVEGIAVEFETPGFVGRELLAIANVVGEHAPQTNVARSSIEATEEKEKLAGTIYKILFDAVASEAKRLENEEGYSLTWAVDQIPYLITPALGTRDRVQYPEAHRRALERLPMLLIEADQSRGVQSIASLENLGGFWTIDSILTRSVEGFIKEARAEITASQLMVLAQGIAEPLPEGAILANYHSSDLVIGSVDTKFEVTRIIGRTAERRLDLEWRVGGNIWLSRNQLRLSALRSGNPDVVRVAELLSERSSRLRQYSDVLLPIGAISTSGLSAYQAVTAYRKLYILPETPLGNLFVGLKDVENYLPDDGMRVFVISQAIASSFTEQNSRIALAQVERFFRQMEGVIPDRWLTLRDPLIAAFSEFPGPAELLIFNPLSWVREAPRPDELDYGYF